MDGVARVFSLPAVDATTLPADLPAQAKTLMALHHHTAPISSVSSSATHLLTASWDATLALFPLTTIPTKHDPSVPAPHQLSNKAQKRRKLDPALVAAAEEDKEEGLVEGGWRVGPSAVLRGHVGRVGRAIWDGKASGGEADKVWSCGWDGSVRGFDVETQVNFLIKVRPSALCFVVWLCANGDVAASAVGQGLP